MGAMGRSRECMPTTFHIVPLTPSPILTFPQPHYMMVAQFLVHRFVGEGFVHYVAGKPNQLKVKVNFDRAWDIVISH
jgi:hypothetical protein